jgi:hypothetical protein
VAVRLEGVTKRYGPVTALDGAGFGLHRGETLALLGPREGRWLQLWFDPGKLHLFDPDDGAHLTR